jgi:hypothetical protein
MTSEGGVKGRGINGRDPRGGRAPVYAAKALDADLATTLPAAGVGWSLTRPGCPTASAGFGAEPQGLVSATSGLSLLHFTRGLLVAVKIPAKTLGLLTPPPTLSTWAPIIVVPTFACPRGSRTVRMP